MIDVSIVSHGHSQQVSALLAQLLRFPEVTKVIVTCNIPETNPLDGLDHAGRVELICNERPLGFGANHNQAFQRSTDFFFCVLNPDVLLSGNPFPGLLALHQTGPAIGVVAPLAINTSGEAEDNFRKFPRLTEIVKKAFGGKSRVLRGNANGASFASDWVSGMCMLFSRTAYSKVQGFDARFFLYYEDVDICVRLWQSGYRVIACPSVSVLHDGHRASHRSLRFSAIHFASLMRFLLSHAGRLPQVQHESIGALR
jgi:GT2 family glycosyltransferase